MRTAPLCVQTPKQPPTNDLTFTFTWTISRLGFSEPLSSSFLVFYNPYERSWCSSTFAMQIQLKIKVLSLLHFQFQTRDVTTCTLLVNPGHLKLTVISLNKKNLIESPAVELSQTWKLRNIQPIKIRGLYRSPNFVRMVNYKMF